MSQLSSASAIFGSMPQQSDITVDDVIPRRAEFPEIAPLLKRIRETYAPQAVLLFGSHARGDNRPDSDWDLLVLLKDNAPESLLDPYLTWEVKQGTGVSADVLCEYENEFTSCRNIVNTLAYEIKNDAIRVD
jgi:predicted nucleotidyltransferase